MTLVIVYDACHDWLSIAKKAVSLNLPLLPRYDTCQDRRKNKWAMSYYHPEKVKTTAT